MKDRATEAVRELVALFRQAPSKHEAHRAAAPVMRQLTREPAFLTAILSRYVSRPSSFERGNYPVVAVEVDTNPYFSLIANCWIPLPGRETDVATKAIHHHGDMLLTTATLFGPGYEHWTFSPPVLRDASTELYAMHLLEAAPHPRHHVAFVDAQIAHCPIYPASLTITLALWSSSNLTGWRDHVKRLPVFAGREALVRNLALRAGLRNQLELKVVEYFDFCPVADGFKGMRRRQEFALGPNADHLYSVFHVVQATGNAPLARQIAGTLARVKPASRPVADRLLDDLDRGRPIEGRLSSGHYGLPHANFTTEAIERALGRCRREQESPCPPTQSPAAS